MKEEYLEVTKKSDRLVTEFAKIGKIGRGRGRRQYMIKSGDGAVGSRADRQPAAVPVALPQS